MSLSAIPVGTGYPYEPLSTPYGVEICFADDGSGGTVHINGQGLVAAGQLDLKTFFGTTFRSSFLLTKFLGQVGVGDYTALVGPRFFKYVDVSFVTVGGATITKTPATVPQLLSGGIVPAIDIVGPGILTTFRAKIQLRHTIDL